MEFTPSPTIQALAKINYITPRNVLEITDVVKSAVDSAIQQGETKDNIFLAGFGTGQNMLSDKGIYSELNTSTKFAVLLTQEYIATVTK